ncbi:MAG: hypothetical protein E7463_10675 [Ruminococcaceae bacterium]|nr:hypothetical protein [Oscillospiraceae bacterium]
MEEKLFTPRENRWLNMLGLCPALLGCATMTEGLVLGLTVLLVLAFTDAAAAGMSRWIPAKYRTLSALIPATLILVLLQFAWMPIPEELLKAPGFMIPTLTIYCILLGRTATPGEADVEESVKNALRTGGSFLLVLMLTTGLRELLGAGTLLGLQVLPESYRGAALLTSLPGGMLVLGFVMAAYSVVETLEQRRRSRRQDGQEEENS